MVCSMTGFARQEATHDWGSLCWEVRSVNHRYLEPHFRLPDSFKAIEPELRNRLRRALNRGKVEMSLSLQWDTGRDGGFTVDQALVKQIAGAIHDIDEIVVTTGPVNAMDILQWPGVVNTQSADREELQEAALTLFDEALKQLAAHRAREGQELGQLIEQRLTAIEKEVKQVRTQVPAILEAQRKKLEERLANLKDDIDPQRLEQELVIYAQKADVAEELDRLVTHVGEVRHTLKQNGPIGRRLDFLMQELNREANTLSSKSVAGDTTQAAVELKILIEQMREQIQNIE